MNTATLPHSPSDSAMMKLIRDSVTESGDVSVEEYDGCVVLSGSVASFYVKQVAQEAVRGHIGQRLLQNHLRVGR